MARLSATILDLARMRGRLHGSKAKLPFDLPVGSAGESRLAPVADFGSNPGGLAMLSFTPEVLPPAPALVVVLHGCTQTAAGYDRGAGWSTLAQRFGFVLVCPQQSTANNPQGCFNWFRPDDVARDRGEAASIRQMVERAIGDHGVDRRRVFVTGLSAGGAMAVAMLAAYPDVFAAGGVVAGLPYGSAETVQQALHAMFDTDRKSGRAWGDLVRAASPHRGPWPRLSVWHGSADSTVKPANAEELLKQWLDLHGLPEAPSRRDEADGYPREVWCDASGQEAIESFTIPGMGHGTPIHVGQEDHMSGEAGAYLFDVGISSSYHMARFWGIADAAVAVSGEPKDVAIVTSDGAVAMPRRPASVSVDPRPRPAAPAALGRGGEIGRVIEDALKAAGLMKR